MIFVLKKNKDKRDVNHDYTAANPGVTLGFYGNDICMLRTRNLVEPDCKVKFAFTFTRNRGLKKKKISNTCSL